MQTSLDILVLEVIGIGVIFQIIWLFITRFGRDQYLSDLTRFSKPNSRLSKFYSWRMESTNNALKEGIAVISIVLIITVSLSITQQGIESLLFLLPYLLFVIALVVLSVIQVIVRVHRLSKREDELLAKMKNKEDKINEAQQIVDWLYSQGKDGDGRLWFILYRAAQLPNPIGYAIRDALFEKRKEIEKGIEPEGVSSETEDSGIGIE
ncbi:MAG: hypothetical protein GF411_06950 [Candidatus Lokiarchaeota archaeon]|nr:hypothetical protein [Candidatus Lokiarchaeota archaeon]